MAYLPTSYLYTIKNGELDFIPRYEHNELDNTLLPEGDYALYYLQKVGGPNSHAMVAKIFIIRERGHKIHDIYSSAYNNIPKFFKEAVEKYIFDELTNGQQTFRLTERKKSKVKKSSTPNCKCRK